VRAVELYEGEQCLLIVKGKKVDNSCYGKELVVLRKIFLLASTREGLDCKEIAWETLSKPQ